MKTHTFLTEEVEVPATSTLLAEVVRFVWFTEPGGRKFEAERFHFIKSVLHFPYREHSVSFQPRPWDESFLNPTREIWNVAYRPGFLEVTQQITNLRIFVPRTIGVSAARDYMSTTWKEVKTFTDEKKSMEIISEARNSPFRTWFPISREQADIHRQHHLSAVEAFKKGSERMSQAYQYDHSGGWGFWIDRGLVRVSTQDGWAWDKKGKISPHPTWDGKFVLVDKNNQIVSDQTTGPNPTVLSPGKSPRDDSHGPKTTLPRTLGKLQTSFPKRAEELRQHALSGEPLSADISDVADAVFDLGQRWLSYLDADDLIAESGFARLMLDLASKLNDFEITLGLWCAVDTVGTILVTNGNFDETRSLLIAHRDSAN